MKLKEIFDQLAFGELSQLSIGGQSAGEINESNYDRVITHVNLGLSALYKRFPLKEGRLNFDLLHGGYTYLLKVDDIHKIEQVLTGTGVELSLNDEGNKYSCMTPSLKVLNVPASIVDNASDLPDGLRNTQSIEVVYRANHPKVVQRVGLFDPARVILELPDSHQEALLYYVAARVLAPQGTGQFEGLAGNNYRNLYEAECQRLTNLDPQHEKISAMDRLRSKGFA